jgi:hypothetical protein
MAFFDGTDTDESVLDKLGVLPEGRYLCCLKTCEQKTGRKDPNCFMFANEFEVVKGEFVGRKIFSNLVFRHSNDNAVKIGMARMKQLVTAITGKPVIDSAAEIVNGLCHVTIEHKKNKDGTVSSEVGRYEPKELLAETTQPKGDVPF